MCWYLNAGFVLILSPLKFMSFRTFTHKHDIPNAASQHETTSYRVYVDEPYGSEVVNHVVVPALPTVKTEICTNLQRNSMILPNHVPEQFNTE